MRRKSKVSQSICARGTSYRPNGCFHLKGKPPRGNVAMGTPMPQKSPITNIARKKSPTNNHDELYKSIKTAITTGDIETGWGKEMLKGIRRSVTPQNPNVNRKRLNSQSPSSLANEQSCSKTNINSMEIDGSTEGPWSVPRKSARIKKITNKSISSPTNVTNAFANLSDIESEGIENSTIYHTPKATRNTNQNYNTNNSSINSPQAQSRTNNDNKKPNFIKTNKGTTATIEIWNNNIKDIVKKFIDNQLTQNDFIIKSKNSDRILIKPKSNDSLEKIKAALADINNWYTYTPQKMKPKNLILKRVYGNYDENDVKNYITNLNLPNVNLLKVIKYVYDKQNPKNFHFIVQIEHQSIARELMNEHIICYQQVKWDWFRKNKVFQCRKCQRVGHASNNGHFDRRCVKCGEARGKEDCKIPKDADKNLLKCANCKNSGHPASYYGCPYLKYAQNQLNAQRNMKKDIAQKKIEAAVQQKTPRTWDSRKINSNITFAQTASGLTSYFPNLPSKHNLNKQSAATDNNNYFTVPNSETQHSHNSNNLQAQINELLVIVNQQHQILMKQLTVNSSRISYIYDHFEIE